MTPSDNKIKKYIQLFAGLGLVASVSILASVKNHLSPYIFINDIIILLSIYILYYFNKIFSERNNSLELELESAKDKIKEVHTDDNQSIEILEKKIKEHEKKQKTLKDKEHNLKLILDNIVDGVIGITEFGTIESFNPAAERIFGYNQEEVIGKSINILMPKTISNSYDEFMKSFRDTNQSSVVGKEREIMARHKDGKDFFIEIGISVSPDTDKKMFIAIIRNITERKKDEEKMREYTDRLEWTHFQLQKARIDADNANHAKSMFLAHMSHEIRTPLNGIMGMTELLMNTSLNEKQEKYAGQIYNSGEVLLELINDILDFSKIEAGEMQIEIVRFDLKEIIQHVENLITPQSTKKNLQIKTSISNEIPSFIKGDPLRTRQILTNLAGNAIKFTKSGSVEIAVSSKQKTDSDIILLFEVIDTGIGIEKDKLDKIFDKFSQVDASTTRKFGGTGLGLAISKQLVELMGGKMGVESSPDKGSKFWFEITFSI